MDEDAFAMFTKMKRLDGAQKLALYPKEYLTADIAQKPRPLTKNTLSELVDIFNVGKSFWPFDF